MHVRHTVGMPTAGLSELSTVTATTALSAWGAASDFLIVIILIATIFLFAWYAGRGPLVALQLSLYTAYALYISFPFKTILPSGPPVTALLSELLLYGLLVLLFYIILRRVVVSDFLDVGIFGLAILSFLGTGFLLSLAYHVFPVASVYTFTPAVDALFAAKAYFWWWFVAPAIGLFLFAR